MMRRMPSSSRLSRCGALAALALLVPALSSCTGQDLDASPSEPSAQTPGSVGQASEEEVGSGWDQEPDEPVRPESDLSAGERTDLLRLSATSAAGAGSCLPEDLSAQLAGAAVSLGHRYSSIVLTNDGSAPCELSGFPGIGARGEWGNQFMFEGAQKPLVYNERQGSAPSPDPGEPVQLEQGERAEAKIEWTGDLGGTSSDSERLETLYVQLFQGTEPITVADPFEATVDLGPFSTVYVGDIETARG
jgi:hypothetical protein